MTRPWIIRCLFMLPLLLCVVGWVVSMGHPAYITHSHAGYDTFCSISWGRVNVGRSRMGVTLSDGSVARPNAGWEGGFFPPELRVRSVHQHPSLLSALGFGWTNVSVNMDNISYDLRAASVPFWFLLVAFSLCLLFLWRKTGQKKPGEVPPVEVKAKKEPS